MEKLGRGVIAMRQNKDSVYVSWRILGTDPDDISFNLYRRSGNRTPQKLNSQPLSKGTNFIDAGADFNVPNSYFVKPLLKNQEQAASAAFTLAAKQPVQQYLSIPLRTPAGYTPNDASVGWRW